MRTHHRVKIRRNRYLDEWIEMRGLIDRSVKRLRHINRLITFKDFLVRTLAKLPNEITPDLIELERSISRALQMPEKKCIKALHKLGLPSNPEMAHFEEIFKFEAHDNNNQQQQDSQTYRVHQENIHY